MVLGTLAVIFWTYFMYLWRTWDSNKRDPGADYDKELADEMDIIYEEMEYPPNQALLNSRRKSVSFAVVQVQDDNLSFDISHRYVQVRHIYI